MDFLTRSAITRKPRKRRSQFASQHPINPLRNRSNSEPGTAEEELNPLGGSVSDDIEGAAPAASPGQIYPPSDRFPASKQTVWEWAMNEVVARG